MQRVSHTQGLSTAAVGQDECCVVDNYLFEGKYYIPKGKNTKRVDSLSKGWAVGGRETKT